MSAEWPNPPLTEVQRLAEEPEPELFATPRSWAAIDSAGFNCYWDPAKFRDRMAEAGLGQHETARRVGASQPSINRWSRDDTPGAQWVPKIVAVLGCELTDLLTRDPVAESILHGWMNYRGEQHANGNGAVALAAQEEADRLLGELILDTGVPKEQLQAWADSRGIPYERARDAANAEFARRNGAY